MSQTTRTIHDIESHINMTSHSDKVICGIWGGVKALLPLVVDNHTEPTFQKEYDVEYLHKDIEICVVCSQIGVYIKRDAEHNTGLHNTLRDIIVDTDRLLCVFNAIKKDSIVTPSVNERAIAFLLLNNIEKYLTLLCTQADTLPPHKHADIFRLSNRLSTLVKKRWLYIVEKTR